VSGLITSARLQLAKLYLDGEPGQVTADLERSYVYVLLANESKRDLSSTVQNDLLSTARQLQSKLDAAQRERATRLAAEALRRPLRNLPRLFELDLD
jgi:hypothetical protein